MTTQTQTERSLVLVKPDWQAVAAGVLTALLMVAGAWCGGEMVYGRGIGVGTSRR